MDKNILLDAYWIFGRLVWYYERNCFALESISVLNSLVILLDTNYLILINESTQHLHKAELEDKLKFIVAKMHF